MTAWKQNPTPEQIEEAKLWFAIRCVAETRGRKLNLTPEGLAALIEAVQEIQAAGQKGPKKRAG